MRMEMKAAVEAEATAKARADQLAWPPREAPPREAVMPEKLAAQEGST